jgi:trehalose 6-phosphate synthase
VLLLASAPAVVDQALKGQRHGRVPENRWPADLHIYALPLHRSDKLIGTLAIVHDAGYIHAESLRIWRQTFLSALAYVFLIVLTTLLIVRWSIAGPIARTATWMKALRTGRAAAARIKAPDLEMFRPLAREVATFAESLNTARSAAELEARLRDTGESLWTADRLAVHVRPALRMAGFCGFKPRTLPARATRKVHRSPRPRQRWSPRSNPYFGLRWVLGPRLRRCRYRIGRR